MGLPGTLAAVLGCLCVLDLAGASPNTINTSDECRHLVSSESAKDISNAILSQQETLQQLLSAVMSKANFRCQPIEVVPPNLTGRIYSAVEGKFEETMESIKKLLMKIEDLGYRVTALEGRPQQLQNRSLVYEEMGSDRVYISKREEKMSWEDARRFCKNHGGTLAMDSVVDHLSWDLRLKNGDVFWMGASRLADEGYFRWLSGEKVNRGWYISQPGDKEDDENCVAYAVEHPGLHDYPCELRQRFICSKV